MNLITLVTAVFLGLSVQTSEVAAQQMTGDCLKSFDLNHNKCMIRCEFDWSARCKDYLREGSEEVLEDDCSKEERWATVCDWMDHTCTNEVGQKLRFETWFLANEICPQ